MSFEEFQDGRHGGHIWYRNRTILAILNLCVTVIPPNKFWLNPTYSLGGDGSIRLTVWEEMPFEEFLYDRHGGHLGYRNGIILAILNLCVTVMPPSSFGSIRLTDWEEMSFEEFQDGGHLGYPSGMILESLNLCVTVVPPIKFQLNWTYGLGGDVIWRISRWPPWRPSWTSERNDFSNSESSCCHNASH